MSERSPERFVVRSYFHSEGGWDNNPEGAELRLDASALESRQVEAWNVIHERDAQGDWRPLAEEIDLDGLRRGLIWETWRTAVDGDEFIAFRGIRVVDEDLAIGLLRDLPIRDEDGILLSDPRRGGRLFLLDGSSATTFARRVKAAGGSVTWGNPLPEEVEISLERLRSLISFITEERASDLKTLNEARKGNFSGIVGFEGRTKRFLALVGEVAEVYISCRRGLRNLLAQGKTASERKQASETIEQARRIRDRAVIAREERDWDAAELARLGGIGSFKIELPSPALVLAVKAIGELARQSGYQVEDKPQNIIIRLPGGTLRIGESFEFQAD